MPVQGLTEKKNKKKLKKKTEPALDTQYNFCEEDEN